MLPYVIAAGIGAALMGRTKPSSSVTKTTCFGPKSGLTYAADLFDGLDVFILSAPDGSKAVFQREDGGLTFVRGVGSPDTITLMREDFEDASPRDA